MLLQLLANGLVMGAIYALVALGFALVYNTTRIFHIAYAIVYVFMAYMFYSLHRTLQMPLIISFAGAILFTIILSLLIEIIIYQPLNRAKASQNVIMISSIGVMIVVVNMIAMFYGSETKVLNAEISSSVTFGHIILTTVQMSQIIISLFLIVMFLLFLKFSQFGIKTRALRDDDELCSVFGLDIGKIRLTLFALSAFFAAVGSGLVAYDVGMDPYVGLPMLLNAVVALIIGGVGRFEAPILGGFLIGLLQALAVWAFSSRWQDAVTFVLLIFFLLFRPQGLLGEKQRAY